MTVRSLGGWRVLVARARLTAVLLDKRVDRDLSDFIGLPGGGLSLLSDGHDLLRSDGGRHPARTVTLIDPVRVHSSTFAVEAHLVKLALESNEIPCALKNELLSGLGGAIGFDDARVEVWVARVDAEDALHLVAELTKTPRGNVSIASAPEGHGELSFTGGGALSLPSATAGGPEPETCPACHEEWEPGFCVCWSCLHELG